MNELGDVSGASAADYKAEAEKDSDEMSESLFHSVSEFLMVSVSRCPLSEDLRRMSYMRMKVSLGWMSMPEPPYSPTSIEPSVRP